MNAWLVHVDKWKDCQKCPLATQRSNIVIARGVVPCDVCFIGEAPGASEDALAQPFVGPAGFLLDQIVERAVPKSVPCAYCNLVCCFPREAKERGDNEPAMNEILACQERLIEFVNIAQPRLIVCVGALAARCIDHHDTVLCCDITHPAHIIRMPLAKKQMAAQRTVVVLRNAIEDMLESERKPFTKWGQHASITARSKVRQQYDHWAASNTNDDDIPF